MFESIGNVINGFISYFDLAVATPEAMLAIAPIIFAGMTAAQLAGVALSATGIGVGIYQSNKASKHAEEVQEWQEENSKLQHYQALRFAKDEQRNMAQTVLYPPTSQFASQVPGQTQSSTSPFISVGGDAPSPLDLTGSNTLLQVLQLANQGLTYAQENVSTEDTDTEDSP